MSVSKQLGAPVRRKVGFDAHATLRARLAEAEETLRAIRSGEIDAMIAAGPDGLRVFTLEGSGYAYRALIESMNEGALILAGDKTILYANQCFASMVKIPLEQVIGGSMRRFLSAKCQAMLSPLLTSRARVSHKIQVLLKAFGGAEIPGQISARRLPGCGFNGGTVGLVVTDMTESMRNEETLRSLARRVLQVQEANLGRVAFELHNHITQLLCAVLVRSQTLADTLLSHEGVAKREANILREMLGQAAQEVERISRHLRPSVLDDLGLVAVLRDATTEFAKRTGVSLNLTCAKLSLGLPADTDLTLYRILQEALKNVEQHARAHRVSVQFRKRGGVAQLTIKDDGIGFDPMKNYPYAHNGKAGLGLLSMRERARYVSGFLTITSSPGNGTKFEVNVPLRSARQRRRLPTPLKLNPRPL